LIGSEVIVAAIDLFMASLPAIEASYVSES